MTSATPQVPEGRRQTLGVCYYPEQWPEDRWAEDARRMRLAGITHVRVGEFAWSRMEPGRGQYNFGWLVRIVDLLQAQGLKVVMCTPTATPPKWLVDSMPDMVAIDREGRPRKFGSRRHYCFSHEGYALECERIVAAMAERLGNHPAIETWQTDNEYGCHGTVESYSDAARDAFRLWLAAKYGTVDRLNEAWGNVFWSMEINEFAEVELPNLTVYTANPACELDFQRFSSDQVVRFNARQVDILRALSPGRTILTNFMGGFTAFDHHRMGRDLDAASWDSYPLGFLQEGITGPAPAGTDADIYMRVGDPDFQTFNHDLYRGCGHGRWWVMEQQPGPVNWANYNPSPAPGAIRMWAHEAYAAGAEVVSYFRWRQAPFAQEQMHEALLLRNSAENEAYGVVQQVAKELAAIDARSAVKRADVALVFDYESAWAWMIQPQGKDFTYLDLVLRVYRELRKAGQTVDVVPATPEAVAGRKAVFVPGLFHAREDFVAALAASGADVLIGPRAGSKTADFQIPMELPPGAFRRMIDITVRRVESLHPGVTIPASGKPDLAAEGWREFVVPGSGVVTALESEDGHPLILIAERVLYLAGRPNEGLARLAVRSVLDRAGLAMPALPPHVRIRDNGTRRYIFNHGPDAVDIGGITARAPLIVGANPLPPCGVAIIDLA